MVLRTLRSLGFPIRLYKGIEIAQGALFRKQGGVRVPRHSLLVVPGGAASIKSAGLGAQGKREICSFVSGGGRYLGFCGGAGLALTHGKGLGLCPWKRASYPERILHLLSGHLIARTQEHDLVPEWEGTHPSIPVWWPGRFSNSGGDVDVLATCEAPDLDFWIADLPIASVPDRILALWRSRYGVNLSADFMTGTELVIHGGYGKGAYVLSYSHLETPDSPDANRWLVHVLARFTGVRADKTSIPPWRLLSGPANREFSVDPRLSALSRTSSDMRSLVMSGMEHSLFVARTSWLAGCKPGLPGNACNNLLAALGEAEKCTPTKESLAFWKENELRFTAFADKFFPDAEAYLWAAKLAETLTQNMPGAVDRASLANERDRIFGHPMSGGGILQTLQDIAEEYFYLCHKGLQEDDEA